MIASIIVIFICICLSAFFSATETAFNSFNRIRMKNLAADGNTKAKRVMAVDEQYDKMLTTVLVGNNVVNIAMTAVATVLFVQLYGKYGSTISTVVMTVVVLIFGEISPKNIAKDNAEALVMFSAPLIKFLMYVLTPLNYIFSQWRNVLNRLFKVASTKGITEDELLTMVEEAETEGTLEASQSELIQNAIEFNELETWDVITPRVDMVAVDLTDSNEEIDRVFKETGYSRVPVYSGDLDKIVGVLNQKDFHNYVVGKDKDISNFTKTVIFVAGSMKVAQLLKKLQVNKTHMAIVVDEYGGTAGLVTMEDIIEELVGDIYDEHDEEEAKDITLLQDGSYRVLCHTNVDKMFDFFDEEVELDATTVNGWVVLMLDKLPEIGDTFNFETADKLFFGEVTKADERKAIEINLRVKEKRVEEE